MNTLGFVKNILSEDNGNPSMMRVVAALIPLVVVGTWSWHCISTGQLVGFDYEEVAALIGPLAAKAWQKGKEAPEASKEVENV